MDTTCIENTKKLKEAGNAAFKKLQLLSKSTIGRWTLLGH